VDVERCFVGFSGGEGGEGRKSLGRLGRALKRKSRRVDKALTKRTGPAPDDRCSKLT